MNLGVTEAVTAVADQWHRYDTSAGWTMGTFLRFAAPLVNPPRTVQERFLGLCLAAHALDGTFDRTLVASLLDGVGEVDRAVQWDEIHSEHRTCCESDGCDPDNEAPGVGLPAGCAGVGDCDRCLDARRTYLDVTVRGCLDDLGRACGLSSQGVLDFISAPVLSAVA